MVLANLLHLPVLACQTVLCDGIYVLSPLITTANHKISILSKVVLICVFSRSRRELITAKVCALPFSVFLLKITMKRAREESEDRPQSKRPAPSRGKMFGLPKSDLGSQHVSKMDAMDYLKALKEAFMDEKGKYAEFIDVMKEFKAQRIDAQEVANRVKEVLKGHRKLILGFNIFLPRGFEIDLALDEERKNAEFNHAINYVNKIKTRFQNDEQVYKAFLEILNMYRNGNKSINEVYQEVAALFRDHCDLLEEFSQFLPGSGVHPLPKVMRSSVPDDKTGGLAMVKKLQREKMDNSLEKPVDRQQHDNVDIGASEKQPKNPKKERREKCEREHKEKDSEQEQENDLDAEKRLPYKSKSAKRADEVIPKQPQVGEGKEASVDASPFKSSMEEKKVTKGFQEQHTFFVKVRGRLQNVRTYREFLKCLDLYVAKIITKAQLLNLITALFGKFPDLIECFKSFLTYCENKDLGDGSLLKLEVEKENDKERGRGNDEGEEELETERGKEREREKSLFHRSMDHKFTSSTSREKYTSKPISELDLSNCERCTPSYRLLPKDYPKPTVSHRTDLGHAVLNDTWVAVTSGSEDYSFKHMRKNQYEESLFRCEDDRFELDMLLQSTAATVKRMEELLDKMRDAKSEQDLQIRVEEYFTAINLRRVEHIYGDHGLDVIELLRKNAAVALPVMLSRLKQKQDEWSKCQADMNKFWAEVYAKNYHKSLDHRSFYFKQQDKKSLSTKVLLAEIKEINERKRKEDDTILSIAAGNRQALIHDLKFEYPEPGINDDLYQIIKYSADEMCSTVEQSDKIMRLWTAFLEPIFGMYSRPHDLANSENVVNVMQSKRKRNRHWNHRCEASSGAICGDEYDMQSGLAVKSKHVVPHGDDLTTASSKACLKSEARRRDRSGSNLAACTNGETTLAASLTSDMRVANLGPGVHKQKSVPAGHLQQEKEGVLGSHSVRLMPRHGTAGRGHNISLKGRDCLMVEDLDRRSNGSRRENKVPESKIVPSALNCSRDEVSQNGSLGRVEREEGELSPSFEMEERQASDYGCGDNLASLAGRIPAGQRSENGIFGGRPDEEEDGEFNGDEHHADAEDEGEESAQKISDSENVSEASEEASGSESGDGDTSHKDHEDEGDDDGEDEGKNESEGEAEEMADTCDGEEDGTCLASSNRSLVFCMPLAAHGPSFRPDAALDRDSRVFYGNDSIYTLFRLHQALYERIHSAKINAKAAEQKWKSTKETASPDLYKEFMQVLQNLLDGSVDNAKFEDDCRAIIGTQSYVLFTLDKLIFKLVKQLQALASDEMANKLLVLHSYEKSRACDGFIDAVYYANACVLLHNEDMYRFEYTSGPRQLFVQLVEDGPEKLDVAGHAMESTFSKYLNDFLLAVPDIHERYPVFLTRNKPYYAKEDEHTAMVKAMRDVHVDNGLEYKISCRTLKVSYVLDTEDFLHRRKRKRGLPNDAYPYGNLIHRRVLRFQKWVDSHSCQNVDS